MPPSLAPAEVVEEVTETVPTQRNRWTELRHFRATSTERVAERTSREVFAKGIDGQVVTSESEQQEELRERTVTHDLHPEDLRSMSAATVRPDDSRRCRPEIDESEDGGAAAEPARDDYATVKELVIGHGPQPAEAVSERDGTTDSGAGGDVFAWLGRMLDDPACPAPYPSEPQAEAALSPEEVHPMYGFVATLRHKVTLVPREHRQDAASAGWHAIQCIRNIFVRLGNMVATASIQRGRFVVLELTESEELQAIGRIVLAPSGAYAYSLRHTSGGPFGDSKGSPGMLCFPMGTYLEEFDSLGWRAKEDSLDRLRAGN